MTLREKDIVCVQEVISDDTKRLSTRCTTVIILPRIRVKAPFCFAFLRRLFSSQNSVRRLNSLNWDSNLSLSLSLSISLSELQRNRYNRTRVTSSTALFAKLKRGTTRDGAITRLLSSDNLSGSQSVIASNSVITVSSVDPARGRSQSQNFREGTTAA